MAVVLFASGVYYCENPDQDVELSEFNSIGMAMYWASITITTVGYGDMVPQSACGQMMAVFASIVRPPPPLLRQSLHVHSPLFFRLPSRISLCLYAFDHHMERLGIWGARDGCMTAVLLSHAHGDGIAAAFLFSSTLLFLHPFFSPSFLSSISSHLDTHKSLCIPLSRRQLPYSYSNCSSSLELLRLISTHTPYTIHHTPYTIHHTPYTIHHITHHTHTPYITHHTPYTQTHMHTRTLIYVCIQTYIHTYIHTYRQTHHTHTPYITHHTPYTIHTNTHAHTHTH